MTMLATENQKKQIHMLLHDIYPDNQQRDEYKRQLVKDYTDGRETSTTKLRTAEAAMMITALEKMAPPKKPKDDPANRMRRKIISMAHEMAWTLPHDPKKADMKRINDWCRNSGYLHKGLNDYTERELPMLVSQFTKVHETYLRDIRK